jgi:GH15 family glucan-1,4-alpha-glucosidase
MDVRALARRSVEVIRDSQSDSGAYVACPTFAPYRFCWLRDGSFIADAMSRIGEVESAERFHDWVARVAVERRDRDRLDARYTLAGEDDTTEWPHLQHDGWGLWLWALREHGRRHERSLEAWGGAAGVVRPYLERVWLEPCTDWWEERVGVHATTLACIAAGLESERVAAAGLARAGERLDASLLLLVVLGLADTSLLDAVEGDLGSPDGGVHRHREDTYYGGGEWLLLTAFHGWALKTVGAVDEARGKLEWVVRHATREGHLPEQSQDHLLHPETWDEWVVKWGPPPSPLLWSHAMFLTLAHELGQV